MRCIVVTGGSGFIRSAVCRELLVESDVTVVNMGRQGYSATGTAPWHSDARYRVLDIEIRDRQAVEAGLHDFEPEAIAHLAAKIYVDHSTNGPGQFIENKVVGTFAVLEAVRRYREWLPGGKRDGLRYLQLSTDAFYGLRGGEEHSNIAVIQAICRLLDDRRPRPGGVRHAELIEFVADRPGHDFRYGLDDSWMRAHFGWEPEISFQSGLRRTLSWYCENADWWGPIRRMIHRGQKNGAPRNAFVAATEENA